MAQHTAIFRADASPQTGGGHVMRCLTLARALADEGWRCAFAVRAPTVATVPALGASGFAVRQLDGLQAQEPAAMAQAWPGGCDLLVVDHYGWSAEDERPCRGWARRIMAIDDLANRPHDCDILLDQNLGRRAADYDGLMPPNAVRLIGPSHALIRPEFAQARARSLDRRTQTPEVRRILIMMGLADAANATAVALDALAGLPEVAAGRIEVRAVLGAGAPHIRAGEAKARAMGDHVQVLVEPKNLVDEMVAADLCIGAGGGSSWERCALGLPTVVVVVAENQRAGAGALAAAGAALLATNDRNSIGSAAAGLLASPQALRDAASKAALVCDGLGARRVACAISPEVDRTGSAIGLRPATLDDLAQTFEWQTAPGARRHSRNPAAPTFAEHTAWFERKLGGPRCHLDIITRAGVPCGVLRLDASQEQRGFEVSILIAAAYQGQGIARPALTTLRRIVPDVDIVACVLDENEASHRAFLSTGFEVGDVIEAEGKTWYRARASAGLATTGTRKTE